MPVVTIPFDYEQLPEPKNVVPICIEDTDRRGRKIAWGWFTAVVPIADRLRGLARRRLNDEWRVSELAETTVHEIWYKHLDDLGLWPSARIWRHAKWKAEDLRLGGWRARRGIDLPLPEDDRALASLFQIADPKALARLLPQRHWDFTNEIERRQFYQLLVNTMKLRGDIQAAEMLDMLCHGVSRAEINAYFQQKPNTLTQSLHRALRRALSELGIR
jgi:DNA-directed RNA polymerase specialized sigma24 family protein